MSHYFVRMQVRVCYVRPYCVMLCCVMLGYVLYSYIILLARRGLGLEWVILCYSIVRLCC